MINVLTKQNVLEKLKKDLLVGSENADEIIVAEYIRSLIWASSIIRLDNTIQVEPVSKRSVLYAARQRFLYLTGANDISNSEDGDFFSKALDELIRVGDVIKLPEGRLAPSQLRLIKLKQSNKFLLVGGMPTKFLPINLRNLVRWSGFSRAVELLPAQLVEMKLPITNIYDWLGIPNHYDTISEWFTAYTKTVNLLTEGINEILNRVEIFINTGFNRVGWVAYEELNKETSGIYLCKTEERPFRYYLVQIKNGKLLSYAEQPRTILRRLRAFFLQKFGRPLDSKVTKRDRVIIFETHISNILTRENKVLSAFGFERRDFDRKVSYWFFPKEGWIEVKPYLKWLGFDLDN